MSEATIDDRRCAPDATCVDDARLLADIGGTHARFALDTADIVAHALAGDARCVATIDCFCGMLGTLAGNLALTLGATGGIYIGGGVVPRLGPLFDASPFRARFEAKGRFAEYLARIPTFVITAPYPAFVGASRLLSRALGEID